MHDAVPFCLTSDLSPVVTKVQNFDELLIPADHVSRSPSDTFYVDDERLLRCHTSAHQNELLRDGHEAFLCTGDVYVKHLPLSRTMRPSTCNVFMCTTWRTTYFGPLAG